jgi:N-glycosylase/DNA lyase
MTNDECRISNEEDYIHRQVTVAAKTSANTGKLVEVSAPDFDLAMTLDSGQVFHWERSGDGFVGTIGEQAVYVEQRGDLLTASCGNDLLRHYFGLDHPLEEICASFPNDAAMNAARDFCHGLRIIRQPKWECLATFICSSMKQVAHIRQISHNLRERFGEPRKIRSEVAYTFPPPDRIAASSEKELRKCALGYRAKNLLATARQIASGDIDLEKLAELADSELRSGLCGLPGVGAKVANCVMLFAYERLRAFPIDVWIERVLREKYFPRARKLNAARLRAFTQEYFGNHGGYAQQYLFHHARKTKKAVGMPRCGVRGPRRRAVPTFVRGAEQSLNRATTPWPARSNARPC